MAYTLNTGHALYGNLVELIGVQSGALVSHKTARTFTPDAGASFGTGTWGEHFHTNGYSYTSRGATISPAIGIDTSTIGSYTIVVVVNGSGNINNGHLLIGTSSPRLWGPRLLNGHIGWRAGLEGSTAVGTGARMITSCRIGETGGKLYLDKTLEASSTALGADYGDPGANANYLGSADQYGISDIVWVAIFNKELSPAEISGLYDSLGANNAFGLVESSAGSNGTATGTPDSLDLIAPTATGNGTGSGTTNGSASGTPSSASLSAPSATGTGTTAGNGTITTPALKNNTGTVLASISGWTVNVYNASTGALVVQKTGLATNSSGILTITDAAIVSGTSYTYEPVHATYGRRLPTGTAS